MTREEQFLSKEIYQTDNLLSLEGKQLKQSSWPVANFVKVTKLLIAKSVNRSLLGMIKIVYNNHHVAALLHRTLQPATPFRLYHKLRQLALRSLINELNMTRLAIMNQE